MGRDSIPFLRCAKTRQNVSMGRPTKLTVKVQNRIVGAIRAGNYAEAAAKSAGVSRRTYQRWLERGRSTAPADAPFRGFRDAVRKAEGNAEVQAVAIVRQAMPNDWRAAMTYLERRYPERWRRRKAADVATADSGEARRDVEAIREAMHDPETRRLQRELVRRIGEARNGVSSEAG